MKEKTIKAWMGIVDNKPDTGQFLGGTHISCLNPSMLGVFKSKQEALEHYGSVVSCTITWNKGDIQDYE